MIRRFLLVFAGLLAVGCNDTAPDGAKLEYDSPRGVSLRYGAQTELAVKFETSTGDPIEGSLIQWSISGSERGSRLSTEESTTNAGGIASINVTAGNEDASFRVVAKAPNDATLEFTVGVRDFDAGTITARTRYVGEESIDLITLSLLTEGTCTSLNFSSLPTPENRLTTGGVDESASFSGVRAGEDYVVVATATGGNELKAAGCIDMIGVTTGNDTVVTIDLLEAGGAGRVEGTYSVQSTMDFTGALPSSIETVVDILSEIGDDNNIDGTGVDDWGQDPGAFVVDLAMGLTCRWECMPGEDFDTCSENNHDTGDLEALYNNNFNSWDGAKGKDIAGFIDGCGTWELFHKQAQELINEQITRFVPGFALNILNMASDLASSIRKAKINSFLIVYPEGEFGAQFRHELVTMKVTIRDLNGNMIERDINLRDAGVMAEKAGCLEEDQTMCGAETAAAIDGSKVIIPSHQFAIKYGELAQYLYTDVVLPAVDCGGEPCASTGDLLNLWIDCDSVAAAILDRVDLPSAVTQSGLSSVCDSAIGAVGALLDNELGNRITDTVGQMSLSGMALGSEPDGNSIATKLVEGQWQGVWGEEAETGNFSGTFTGMRSGDAPRPR